MWGIGWFLHGNTGWKYSISMDGELHNLSQVQWVAQCAQRLREHWPHADVSALEEAAMDLWRDDDLRSLAPIDAAARWLEPLEVKQ